MLLVVGVGLLVNSLWSGHSVLGAGADFSSNSLLASTNADRVLDNEVPLTLNAELAAAAQAKANDMVSKDYWAHVSPNGTTPWDFITGAGYQYQAAGENLAYGFDNASQTVIGWMNSPEHRANILDVNYQNVGFGVASSQNYQGKGPETVVVAEYGDPAVGASNIAFTVPSSGGVAGAQDTNIAPTEIAAQPVSRIQLLTGGRAQWSLFAASLITSVAILAFVLRHGLRFRRLLVEGEVFVAHHPVLDVTIVFIFTAGFVLTRASGVIR
jgi:hypothetical protein